MMDYSNQKSEIALKNISVIIKNNPILKSYLLKILKKYHAIHENEKVCDVYLENFEYVVTGKVAESDSISNLKKVGFLDPVFLCAFDVALSEMVGYYRSHMYKLCTSNLNQRFDDIVSDELRDEILKLGEKIKMAHPIGILD